MLQIIHGDLLEADTDALLLTIDGTDPRSRGNLASAFARRFPGAWADLEPRIPHPIPLGSVACLDADDAGCPFAHIVLASTLHHNTNDVHLDTRAYLARVRSATSRAMSHAARAGASSMAMALMTGGWRAAGAPKVALEHMVAGMRDGYRRVDDLELEIHILDRELHRAIAGHWDALRARM